MEKRYESSKNKTTHKNIYFSVRMNKWYSKVTLKGTVHNIGYFETEREVLLAYDRFAIKNNLPTYILKQKQDGGSI